MTKTQDYIKVHGDTVNFNVTLSKNGEVLDVSNATIQYILKTNKSDSDAEAIFSVNADVTDAATGKFTFTLSKDQTSSLKASEPYHYHMEIVEQGGDKYTFQKGTITFVN